MVFPVSTDFLNAGGQMFSRSRPGACTAECYGSVCRWKGAVRGDSLGAAVLAAVA